MHAENIQRVSLIGPESTGKTSLCKLLAQHYKSLWVPEYARVYVEKLKRSYTLKDIENIAETQLAQEVKLIKKANKIIFTDTELIVAKVWSEDVFNYCPEWIEEEIETNPYDFYLLTFPDIKWKPDPVRENPHRRTYFFKLYLKELQARKFKYEIVSGNGDERFKRALKAVQDFLGSLSAK